MPFTDFTSLAIISLLMAIISIRTIYQTIQNRKTLFDENFTRADRQHMSVAAFFILIPISVLLHEVGHALAIWWYGGDVVAFGFFFFFGFVGYEGITDAVELFWIALWGNIVSVALGLGALLLAFLRPMRAAVNYLFIMFGLLSIVTSLIFYPVLDLLSDLHGDWSRIYSSETMEHAVGTGIVHAAILLGLVIAWQMPKIRLRFAEITGLRPEEVRKVNRKQVEHELAHAAKIAAAEFDGPVRVESGGSNREAVSVRLIWTSGGYNRMVVVIAGVGNRLLIEIFGGVRALDGSDVASEQRIKGLRGLPEPERVAPYILRALRQVDKWELAPTDSQADLQA